MDEITASCIDLFAGCGGLSLGLKEAGWNGLFAIERDPMAFETLSRNFLMSGAPYPGFSDWPEWLPKTNHDIVKLLQDESTRSHFQSLRGKVTLMAGGPPCQGFSVGGRRDGADERNTLVYQMLDMVELVRPKMVLIENVEGITRRFVARPGEASTSVAEAVVAQLSALGYSSTFDILDASRFGVPQSRRRVVIVGIQDSLVSSGDLKICFANLLEKSALDVRKRWRLKTTKDTSAKEAIDDLFGGTRVECPDSSKFESSIYTKATSSYARAMRRGSKSGSTPNSHRFSKHGERVLELYNLAHQTQPAGRLAKSFLLENGTKKDKKVLIDPTKVVSTITTHPDEFIHYAEPRNITVREMARLQSFPDNFHFHGRYTINGPRRKYDVARCSQVGNAVPPLLAEGIGLALLNLLKYLEEVSSKTPLELLAAERVQRPYSATPSAGSLAS